MGEVDFSKKEDDYKVKIVDGGEYKEPGGGIRKPSQEEIDAYKPHRIVVMIIFGLVVAILLLLVVILIATVDSCEPEPKVKKLPWWKGGVMYNVYPRSFKDSDKNDGVGDFKGIIEKLDYIKKLGVEILYLSSIFKVDKTVDYGYAVIDYKDTNQQYGSLKTFENLVKAAHKEDIKVVIEFVPFDTSVEHQWFKDSENVTGSKRDWYIWRNATNVTSGQIWAKDDTGKYQYLHRKGEKQLANLNWGNANVQKELESVLGFWLDKGVDGFRVVPVREYLSKPPLSNDLSKLHNLLNKWHNYTTKKNAVLIGSSVPPNLAYYGSKSLPEFDLMLNFELVPDNDENMQTFYRASNFKTLIENYIDKLPNGMWPSWVLTSWVHKRVGSNVDAKLAKSLNVLLLTLPGSPVVFYGDEIGMKDVNGTGNRVNQSPMQWSTDKNAGFSAASSTWFGAVGNASYANAEDDPQGIKEIFKKAVKLRSKNNLGFLDGSLANFTIVNQNDVLIYTFKSEPKPRFVVAINFGRNDQTVNLNVVGVKEGDLKLYTSDTEPKAMDMNKVKIPSMALFVFQITENMD